MDQGIGYLVSCFGDARRVLLTGFLVAVVETLVVGGPCNCLAG